jgi:predicted nucleotidyltransferase
MGVEQRIREVLRSRPEVRLAVLFGSRARGQAASDSDVDLAVQGEGLEPIHLAAELGEALGVEVDVVEVDDVGYPLLKSIVRDGRVIYEASPGAEARWRARAIARLETDRPWFERMRRAWLQRLASGA